MNIKNKLLLLVFTVLICQNMALGQKKQKAITEDDEIAIKAAATKTLYNFFGLINYIASSDNADPDKNTYIQTAFSGNDKIFINKNDAKVEDDWDPGVTATGSPASNAIDYIAYVENFYIEKDINDTVAYSNVRKSPILIDKHGRKYIKLYYNQQFTGKFKTHPEIPYAMVKRVAEMTVYSDPVTNEWRANINFISFYDSTSGTNIDTNFAAIDKSSVATQNTTVKITATNSAYYNYLITKGIRHLNENNFVKAYLALKEAQNAEDFKKQASDLLEQLIHRMAKSNILDPNAYLYGRLITQGREYTSQYRYKDALKAYKFALELQPGSASINDLISDVNDKIDFMAKLENLYNNGLYNEAIEKYKAALTDNDNENNPYLYLGLAKCYAKTNDQAAAESNYTKAISLDATNPDLYRERGRYYEEKLPPDYTMAYNSFVNAINNIPDADNPELAALVSEKPFCKGMMIYKSGNYNEALDSFKQAIAENPGNAAAYYHAGICYEKTTPRDYKSAIESLKKATEIKNDYADAYFELGKIYNIYIDPDNNRDYLTDAIENVNLAIKYDTSISKTVIYHFILGTILQKKGERFEKTAKMNFLDQAIENYTSFCINNNKDTNNLSAIVLTAYLQRAICYFDESNYSKACEDYSYYRKNHGFKNQEFEDRLANKNYFCTAQ